MKEAAGNANITVITIVLIGVVASAGLILLPRITKNIKPKGCCENAGGKWENNKCIAINPDLYNKNEYEECMAE